MFFDHKIMLFDVTAKNSTEVITALATQLEQQKIVKSDFLPHALEREKSYPTGLATEGLGVAIPHTDSKYVNQSQIAFATLKNPVSFKNMVNLENEVPVSLVFMIAMASPHEQAGILSNLMSLFQDKKSLIALKNCTTKEAVVSILHDHEVI
jgi:PTS system galactitol-specific IIA component